MNTAIAESLHSGICLPPGLMVPGPDVSTEQFRLEVFNHSHHTPEEMIEFGAFVTALNVWVAPETGRISMMPTQQDIRALAEAGYGMKKSRMHKNYGGEGRLQAALGFFVDGQVPDETELVNRLKWMASEIFPYDSMPDGGVLNIKEILRWGYLRNLLPSREIIYRVLGGNTSTVQKIFGIEKPDAKRYTTVRDTFKIGVRILDECGGPITQAELNERYAHLFFGLPYSTIRAHHGSLNNFWAAFGFYPNARGISSDELIGLGVKYAFQNGGNLIKRDEVSRLSAQYKFPSAAPIIERFRTHGEYLAHVRKEYLRFRHVRGAMRTASVSGEVIDMVTAVYRPGVQFESGVREHLDVLSVISNKTYEARYVRSLIRNGFSLTNDEDYLLQLDDFKAYLIFLGINDREDWAYLLSLMPHTDVAETMAALQ